MNVPECAEVRAALPELAAGRVSSVAAGALEEHLRGCAACGSEAALVRLVLASRPAPPIGLADRIRRAVEPHPRPRKDDRRWWTLAAAAVAAVALGIGVSSGPPAGVEELPAYVAETEAPGAWPSGDGEIAGAPALEELTDEELFTLLQALDGGGVA